MSGLHQTVSKLKLTLPWYIFKDKSYLEIS